MKLTGYIVEKFNNMAGAYTCHRLVEEAKRQGILLDIVGVHDSCLTQNGILNAGVKLEKRDFIINRYKWGPIKDELNKLVLRSYNKISCYDIYKNKYEQVRRLRSGDFLIPKYILSTSLFPYETLTEYLEPPFVAKALENSMGREVLLIETKEQYLNLQQDYLVDKEWLFEEFITSSFGKDLRLFSIRGKAVACMMRKSKGDFRANVALGASVQSVPITPLLERIAEDIYRQTELDFVGIDLMFGKEDYYFCEINVMPGLEGIEKASGINIAALIIDMIKQDFTHE